MSKEDAGRKGGLARAEILPPERKSEIARSGAVARWGQDFPVAEYEGEFATSQKCHVMMWRNGVVPGVGVMADRLEDQFPGMIVPYEDGAQCDARIVTFDTPSHTLGGWVSEYWEKEAA